MDTKLHFCLLRSLFIIASFTCSVGHCYADYDNYDFSVDGVYYKKTANTADCKTVKVTFPWWDEGKYHDYPSNNYSGDIIIPSTVTFESGEYTVTGIDHETFSGSSITSIVLPNSITSIGREAFSDCRSLISISLPQSVKSIGSGAFDGCTNLVSANIPDGVTSIDGLFANCRSLSSIEIPNSVTYIGSSSFQDCSSLSSVVIPNSVTSIGQSAFYGCSSLVSATISKGVSSISASLFQGCSSLSSVIIPDGVTTIGNYAFQGCSSLASMTIPNNVNTIGGSVFKGCTALNFLTIPNDVVSVGSLTFEDTPWYNNQPDGVVYIGKALYKYKGTMPDNTTISVKEGTVMITASAFYNCVGLSAVNIPNSITSIGTNAFSGCSNLFTVYINSNALTSKTYYSNSPGFKNIFGAQVKEYILGGDISQIGQCAFYECEYLSSVTIPNSVTSIGVSAFKNCTRLTKANFASIECLCNIQFNGTWGYYANPLYYAKHLYINGMEITNVVIPEDVTSIGAFAFYNGSQISSVTIPESVTSIGREAFYGTQWYNSQTDGVVYAGSVAYTYKGTMPQNTEIEIKEGTTAIADSAFSFKRNLVSVTIPSSVTSIGRFAFYECSGLTKAEYGSIEGLCNIQFKSYASNPLYYAKHLYVNGNEMTNVVIPSIVESINNYAFYNCGSLTSVSIPNSVTSIGYQAFSNCSSLTSVSIPNSVTSIGYQAFSNCSSLTSVTIYSNKTSIGFNAFASCNALTKAEFSSIESLCNMTFEDTFSNPLYYAKHLYIKGEETKRVTIPMGVKSVGNYAFVNCNSISSFDIPSSVNYIGNSTFSGCSAITSIVIPYSVTSIGNSAFYNCNSLNYVMVENQQPSENSGFSNNWNITLYVPKESSPAYTDKWKGFKEIVEYGGRLVLHDFNACPGGLGSTCSIGMTNFENVIGFQFDLQLPEGVGLVPDTNGKYVANLTGRKVDHTLSVSKVGENTYRFISVSMNNEPFEGTEGTLINMTVKVDDAVAFGNYDIKVLNAELTTSNMELVNSIDETSVLTVKNADPGDANGDMTVSVTDVGCTINYILEQVPSVFIFDAADINGDKNVSVTDVSMIINIILNEGSAASPKLNRAAAVNADLTQQPTTDGYQLRLENKNAFIGFQTDLQVDNGANINGMKLIGGDDHLMTYLQLANGTWRVICYSPTNSTFEANEAGLLNISTTGGVSISNIRLTTADLNEVSLDTVTGETTGITDVKGLQNEELKVYTLDGRLCRVISKQYGENPMGGLKPGVYMIGNRKIVIR